MTDALPYVNSILLMVCFGLLVSMSTAFGKMLQSLDQINETLKHLQERDQGER